MKKITATELARNLRAVLDRVRESNSGYIVERGGQPVVQLMPTPGAQTAEQALADLYRTLPPAVAELRLGIEMTTDPGASTARGSRTCGWPARPFGMVWAW